MWHPTATTQVVAVLGQPVRHSMSPVIHNAAFRSLDLDWLFVAFEVAAGSAGAAVDGLRALGVRGASVTMPHKAAVIAALDDLSPEADRLQAVNTIVTNGDRLAGHNTDGMGFIDSLRIDEGFDPSGCTAVVAGAGGAARAVIAALADAGAAKVIVVNRTTARAEAAAALAAGVAVVGEADSVDGADLVVNATPVGMAGHPLAEMAAVADQGGRPVDGLPFDSERLGSGQLVVDLVYQPEVTPLMAAARAQGAATTGGLGMLIHQAAHAFRLWTGEDPPLEVMSAAALATLAARMQGA